MKILDLHISRQIWLPSLLALAAICFVAVGRELQDFIEKLPVEQITLGDISKLSMFLVPTLVVLVVPAMYLMGIMLAFGRLAQQGEIIAMKAAGIPLKRVILPVIAGGAVLSGACFAIQDRLQPWAFGQVEKLAADVALRVTLDVLAPGVMHDFRGLNVYFRDKDPEQGILYDIDILQPDDDGGVMVYSARSARLTKEGKVSKLVLKDCHIIPSTESGRQGVFKGVEVVLTLPPIELRSTVGNPRKLMTLVQLVRDEARQAKLVAASTSLRAGNALRSLRLDIATRTSIPFACLAVSLVAAPLGVRARRSGRSYTFSVGAGIILVYYVLMVLVEPTSLHSLWVTVLRAWIPNLVLMTGGLWLVWRVDAT